MDTNKTESSYGWLIILLIFIVVLGFIFGGGNIFGGRGNEAVGVGAMPLNGCGYVSNCQVEKQTIINTATTQNLINEQAEATRAQASRIYEAQQAEKLFDLKLTAQTTALLNGQEKLALKAENDALKNVIYTNDKFAHVNHRLDEISCRMLPKPELFGVATTCSGQTIPDLS